MPGIRADFGSRAERVVQVDLFGSRFREKSLRDTYTVKSEPKRIFAISTERYRIEIDRPFIPPQWIWAKIICLV